jgi:hypothetical protein
MNKVFVLVHRESYEGDTVFGVYSNLDRAKIALSDMKLESPHCNLKILEVQTDEEPSWFNPKVIDLSK